VIRAKAFLQLSDLRLKADIHDLTDAVNIITQLKGKTFTWKGDMNLESGGKRVVGLIAQEVRKVIPEVVHEDPEGFLTVAYAEIIPVLIEAFKQQLQQYESDKQDVKDQIFELKEKIEKLENQEFIPQGTYSEMKKYPLEPMEIGEGKKRFTHLFSYKRTLLAVGTILSLLVGLTATIFGSILLGISLSAPPVVLSTTVYQARNLQGMSPTGLPDTFCEVTIGAAQFRTSTVWANDNPVWEQKFTLPIDSTVQSVAFEVYEDNSPLAFGAKPLAYGFVSLSSMQTNLGKTQWLTLVDPEGKQTTSGLQVGIFLQTATKVDFEIAILVLGALLTASSLLLGSYLWKMRRTSVPSKSASL